MSKTLAPVVLLLLSVACSKPSSPASDDAAPPASATIATALDASLSNGKDAMTSDTTGPTFASDVEFLGKYGEIIVLASPRGGRIALSPAFQGRVMTSAVGERERGLGFLNRSFIESKKSGTPFDNYGGEDRFWLGPEGGQYGLYFPPKTKTFAFDAWQTPHAMQEGAWEVRERKDDHVVFHRAMTLTNVSGADFVVDVVRTVRLLGDADLEKRTGAHADDLAKSAASFVAYETENKITNAGKTPWTKDKGLVSVWILAMFAPAPDAHVIIPFVTGDAGAGPIVNDAYFGKVPAERLRVREAEGLVDFTCDGNLRSKIGLGPSRAKEFLGSYSASQRLLTIVHYDKPKGATDYVNSMWEEQKNPYGGDVVNSYNDGPTGPGKPSLGGFYEIETSSPAAALAPGQSLVHTHRTFHIVGDKSVLEPIAKKTLGASL